MSAPAEVAPRPRAVRRWLNKLAQTLELMKPAREPDDMYRADGRIICESCGSEYWRHAEDPRDTHLHMLCNGDRVKL